MTKTECIQKLVNEGLAEIEQKYGPSSSHPLPYHSAEHARDAMAATKLIAEKLGLQDQVALLMLAACYHDVEQSLGPGANEDRSCEILSEKMKAEGCFEAVDIELVHHAIQATKVTFDGPAIKQAATEDLPTQVLADADLAGLGREFATYWDRALKLRREHGGQSPAEQDSEFLRGQIIFMTNHRFYTEAANQLFPHKSENITRIKELLGEN